MKKLKIVLSVFVVFALLAGLFIKNMRSSKEITKSEFLFDTLCSITVFSEDVGNAVDKAFDKAARIHRLADFYDSQSDVSKINNAKCGEAVKVDADIINMLIFAREMYQKSNGAYDITIAPLTVLWDFKAEKPVAPNDANIKSLLPTAGCDALVLDTQNMTVTKKGLDVKIDLGSIAKGYATDCANEVLKKSGIQSALIDFGGNITVLGENPKTENKMWRIGLQTPFAATGDYSQILELSFGAVVTSGTYQRYFEQDGKRYHHIIDPKTGYPAERMYDSVTVSADSAMVGDGLSTAIFVMGEQRGSELAAEYGAEVYFLNIR